eukprot:TRINITY_DN7184_c0_g1_i2.p1 TRINITY_DN7184_c0_g1~~TRINITY_DN7184_c0_g1_i2.p1  ORF type:complete len:426 (-),score=70.01 TRINITY_DN7184_c0_g1_i2:53-1330(-)
MTASLLESIVANCVFAKDMESEFRTLSRAPHLIPSAISKLGEFKNDSDRKQALEYLLGWDPYPPFQEQANASSFELPDDIFLSILSKLNGSQLCSIATVSKKFYNTSNKDILWKPFCQEVHIFALQPIQTSWKQAYMEGRMKRFRLIFKQVTQALLYVSNNPHPCFYHFMTHCDASGILNANYFKALMNFEKEFVLNTIPSCIERVLDEYKFEVTLKAAKLLAENQWDKDDDTLPLLSTLVQSCQTSPEQVLIVKTCLQGIFALISNQPSSFNFLHKILIACFRDSNFVRTEGKNVLNQISSLKGGKVMREQLLEDIDTDVHVDDVSYTILVDAIGRTSDDRHERFLESMKIRLSRSDDVGCRFKLAVAMKKMKKYGGITALEQLKNNTTDASLADCIDQIIKSKNIPDGDEDNAEVVRQKCLIQ